MVELIEHAAATGADDITAAVDLLSTEAIQEITETHPEAPAAATAEAAAKPAGPAIKAGATANALAAPRGGTPDNLTLIKGIGPVNERRLNEHGIFHFDQIAAWKKADVIAAEAYLAFDGRIAREDWIGQAKKLAKESQGKPAAKKTGGAK